MASESSSSSSSIMSVREMIDTAFGEPEVNVVNHKLIQTILYILARQLRILERRVEINIGPRLEPSSSSLSITEVKVHAMTKTKKKAMRVTSKASGGAMRITGGLGGVGGMGGGGGSKGSGGGGMGGGGGGMGGGGGGMGGGGGSKGGGGGGMGGGGGGMGGGGGSMAGGGGSKGGGGGGMGGGGGSMGGGGGSKGSGGGGMGGAGGGQGQQGGRAVAPGQKSSTDKSSSDKTPSDKTSSDKTSSDKTSSGKTSSAKTSSDKKSSSEKTSSGKTSSDKTSSDKTSSDKTSSNKTSSDKTSSDKTSTDKTSSLKTSSDKTSSNKTSSDKTTTFNTSSDKTSSGKTTTDKTSSDKTTSDKTSSDKTSSDKTSSAKTSSDKTSSNKTSSDKSTTDKSSTEKSSSDKTSSDKPSTDKSSSVKTSSDKTSSDKTSSAKTSSDKPSSSDKTSSDPTTTSKSTTEKSSSRETSDTTSSSMKLQEYSRLLEKIEEQREAELRVIHQRADSREDNDKTPSPMASMDSVEATYEKLLIVERIPAEEAKARAARGRSGTREEGPRISVVTQEQFDKLATVVRQLQQKFGPVGSATFPENVQLMQELRKGASLTDAMAALQLSARLEASEKGLEQMLSLVTELASKTPGIDLSADAEEETQILFGGGAGAADTKGRPKSAAFQKPEVESRKDPSPQQSSSDESLVISLPRSAAQPGTTGVTSTAMGTEELNTEKPDRITYDELDDAMQELHDEILKTVNALTTKSAVNADNAYKIASKLEGRIDASLNLGTRMNDLETLVADYSVKINVLDTSLGSQMTNYQEELTQMQHDLETALETMAEVLANAGGDTAAVAELNAQFSNLQFDIDDTSMRQKELKNTQNALAFDLESLRKQIEILRETKSDREEVADALRDKAGLGALNGLVSLQQFDAVRGDMEKQIGSAYDKFNSQEVIWQKAIDELIRELNEKADWIQIVSLKEDINRHLENLRCRLHAMMEIVGEPRAAAVAKKLQRDATCLSCATPADLELEQHGVPALPAIRPPAIGAEARKPDEDGDHAPCYPGHPIPHPRDPRSHVCHRWCGGSHTVVSNTVTRAPVGMILTPVMRQVTTALGSDGKSYMVDEDKKPCTQCIMVPNPAPSLEQIKEQKQDIVSSSSGMTLSDFRHDFENAKSMLENETPPPPHDED